MQTKKHLAQFFVCFSALLFFSSASRAQMSMESVDAMLNSSRKTLFEKNEGQFSDPIHYQAEDHQAIYQFFSGGFRTSVQSLAKEKSFSYDLIFDTQDTETTLAASNKTVNPLTGAKNYFLTGEKILKDVPFYSDLSYLHVWEGIDVHFHESPEGMKYDFLVKAGADPGKIGYRLAGIESVEVSESGELVLETPFGKIRKGKPVTWQVINGEHVPVTCSYQIDDEKIRFKVDTYDPRYDLVIDPVALKYSTILGTGLNDMQTLEIRYKNDKLYLSGYSYVRIGNTKNQPAYSPTTELGNAGLAYTTLKQIPFIMCMKADGSAVEWFTIFNLPFNCVSAHLQVNEEGDVFSILKFNTATTTYSIYSDFPNIPATVPGIQKENPGKTEIALIRLNNEGTELAYFSYLQPYPVADAGWKDQIGKYENSSNIFGDILTLMNNWRLTPMELIDEQTVVFSVPWKRNAANPPADPIALLPAGSYYHNKSDKDGDFISSVYKINTAVDGATALESALYLENVQVQSMDIDSTGNIYVAGTTINNLQLDFITGTITDTSAYRANTYAESLRQSFVAKFDPGMTQNLFGTIVGLNYGTARYYIPSVPYVFPNIQVDKAGTIYLSDNYYVSKNATQNSAWAGLPTFPDPVYFQAANTTFPEPVITEGDYFKFNLITKLSVEDYLTPALQIVKGGADMFAPQFLVDNKGYLHLYSMRRIDDETVITPGAFQKIDPSNYFVNSSIPMYQRLNPAGELVYSTDLAKEAVRNIPGPLSLDIDESSGSVYLTTNDQYTDFLSISGNTYGSSYGPGSFPLTRSYRDPNTNKKVSVINDAIPFSTGIHKTFLAVFHEPEIGENTIDTFPDNDNTFCVGSLIGLGDSRSPLTGSAPVYVAGDGSDSTHNIPLIFVKGVPRPHPTPKTPELFYQWQKSTDDGNSWENITGANKKDFIPEPSAVPDTIQFRRRMIDGPDTTFSNTTTVYITDGNFTLTISGPEDPVYYCPGITKSLGITISGATGDIDWQWYQGFSPLGSGVVTPTSGTGAAGTFTASIDAGITLDDGGLYRLVVGDATGCKTEYFLTLVPLSESIYRSATIDFCPGEGGVTLGPNIINPFLDYQITGPSSFQTNNPNPFIEETASGTYSLQVKLFDEGSYCVGGQTQVTLNAAVPHDPLLTQLPDIGFCESDAPSPIGLMGTEPTGYTYSWLPRIKTARNGISDLTAANPDFDPEPRPYGQIPIDQAQMLFSATRTSDNCVFTSAFTLTDTAIGKIDLPDTIRLSSCDASFVVLLNEYGAGTYFDWELLSTNYSGGKSALFASADFGFNVPGQDTAATKGVTLFFPTGDYQMVLGIRGSYFPIGSVQCEAYKEVVVSLRCGVPQGFVCTEIQGEEAVSGLRGVCGDTVQLMAQNYEWVNSYWYVTEVDGVAQPANSSPKGLFTTDINGNLTPLGAGGAHPTTVSAIVENPTWGYPNAEEVKYIFKGTYYLAKDVLRTCVDTVRVYTPKIIPEFGIKDIVTCDFPGPGTEVSSTKSIPYTLANSDYSIYPPAGSYAYSWTLPGGVSASDVVSDTASLNPAFSPTKTSLFVLTVKDTITGCSASEAFQLRVIPSWVDAGKDMTGLCPGVIVQMNGSVADNFDVQWTPSFGSYYPTPDIPNDTVPNPYFSFPTTAGITLTLTATHNTGGCVVKDEIVISSGDGGPDPISSASYSGCPYGQVTIGPPDTYNATADQSYQWTAGSGANTAWLSDAQVLNPTVSLPADFSGSATFTLTISAGSCGMRTANFTINAIEPSGVNQPATLNLTSCGISENLGANIPSGTDPFGADYSYFWTPTTDLYLQDGSTYKGGVTANVYPAPKLPTTYNLVLINETNGCLYTYPTEVNPPSGIVADAGEDVYYCMGGDPVQIGKTATGGSIQWIALFYNPNPDLEPNIEVGATSGPVISYLSSTSNEVVDFSQTTPAAGSYMYQLIVDQAGCNYRDEVIVRVRELTEGFAGKDQTVCSNTPFELGLGTENTMTNMFFEWSILSPENSSTFISNPNSANPECSINSKHVFEVYYRDIYSGCEKTDVVAYDIAPELVLDDAVGDTSCEVLSSFDVTTLVSGYDTLKRPIWHLDAYPSAAIDTPTTFGSSITRTFYLEARNRYGCKDVAEVIVPVEIPQQPLLPTPIYLPLGTSTLDLTNYTPGVPTIAGGSFSWHQSADPAPSTLLDSLTVPKGTYYLYETTPAGCNSPVATLEVTSLPSKFTASLGHDSISIFAKTSLLMTLVNPDPDNDISNINFSVTLPTGLEVAPGPLLNTCGGTIDTTGGTSLQLTSGTVEKDSSCYVSLQVKGPAGTYPLASTDFTIPTGVTNAVAPDTLVISSNGDYDGDGVDDQTEISNGSDFEDACDPVQAAGYTGYVATNIIWKAADCDGDSLSNGNEVFNNADPYNDDTDGDGVSDNKEVTDGDDPSDPCDPTQIAGYSSYDNTSSVWQMGDCDGDGLTNSDELTNSTDPYNDDSDGDGVSDDDEVNGMPPTDPLDPCDPSQNEGYTAYDNTNAIWLAADCDMDGLTNAIEDSLGADPYNDDSDGDGVSDYDEVTGDDPSDPADACDPAQESGYTGYDSSNMVWQNSDCDGDSLSNGDELTNSTDPFDDDTDGDGVSDYDEVNGMPATDPLDPCDPSQDPGYAAYDSTSTTWKMADCDMDGLTNGVEDSLGTDPYLDDTDGDGVSDYDEVNNMPATDPTDPCDPVAAEGSSSYISTNPVWQMADCDGDGVDNGTEDTNMTDPFAPCSPVQSEGYAAYDSTNLVWQAADCDGDGLTNGVEDSLGTDAYKTDTDGDGISDYDEVNNMPATDPLDPCDPIPAGGFTGFDLTNPYFLNADCDGDGLSNNTELNGGSTTDPFDPCDPEQDPGYSDYDPENELWAEADCDGDGLLNALEDSLSSDPYQTDPNMELYGVDSLIQPGSTSFSSADRTSFGARSLGSVRRFRFDIKNVVPGANASLVTGPIVTLTGGDGMFTLEYDHDCSILPGSQAALLIQYYPTAEGCHTATISIPHNDPNKPNPYTFQVQGWTKGNPCK